MRFTFYRSAAFFFFFLLTSHFIRAQDRCPGVPFGHSRNPQKLAAALTRDLKTDQEKVDAIYCWITSHIKYDLKKFLRSDFSKETVKHVLRKRKAVCQGYCDLFNELCKNAGVFSAGVPGYIKNKFVDLNDRVYLDEHIWNAVRIEDDWRLVDATWDAGYIQWDRRTIRGFFVHTFTLGKRDIRKFKPHFVQQPKREYYLKNGNYFLYDHLPADPIWQLRTPTKSAEEFESDSAFYLSRRLQDSTPGDFNLDSKRMEISTMTDTALDIFYGPRKLDFNRRNHMGPAKAYSCLATQYIARLPGIASDTVALQAAYDTIADFLGLSVKHFDSTLSFLSQQNTELILNSKLKNNMAKSYYDELMKSTTRVLKDVSGVKGLSKATRSRIKAIFRQAEKQSKRINQSEAFYRARYNPEANNGDSANLMAENMLLKDSIKGLAGAIEKRIQMLQDSFPSEFNKFETFHVASKVNRIEISGINSQKINFEDDLDYFLQGNKDDLRANKITSEASLYDTSSRFIITQFRSHFRRTVDEYTVIFRMYSGLFRNYAQLARTVPASGELNRMYSEDLNGYNKVISGLPDAMKGFEWRIAEYEKISKPITKCLKKELKEYKRGLRTERFMFSFRNKYLQGHYRSLGNLTKSQRSQTFRSMEKYERALKSGRWKEASKSLYKKE